MTGRLAPGANVVAEMPGRCASASPSVAEGWLSSCCGVTTVVETKFWSGEICSPVPAKSGAGGGVGCAGAEGAWDGAGGRDGETGLGVVTVMPGNCVCACSWVGAQELRTATAAIAVARDANPPRDPGIAMPLDP